MKINDEFVYFAEMFVEEHVEPLLFEDSQNDETSKYDFYIHLWKCLPLLAANLHTTTTDILAHFLPSEATLAFKVPFSENR